MMMMMKRTRRIVGIQVAVRRHIHPASELRRRDVLFPQSIRQPVVSSTRSHLLLLHLCEIDRQTDRNGRVSKWLCQSSGAAAGRETAKAAKNEKQNPKKHFIVAKDYLDISFSPIKAISLKVAGSATTSIGLVPSAG